MPPIFFEVNLLVLWVNLSEQEAPNVHRPFQQLSVFIFWSFEPNTLLFFFNMFGFISKLSLAIFCEFVHPLTLVFILTIEVWVLPQILVF